MAGAEDDESLVDRLLTRDGSRGRAVGGTVGSPGGAGACVRRGNSGQRSGLLCRRRAEPAVKLAFQLVGILGVVGPAGVGPWQFVERAPGLYFFIAQPGEDAVIEKPAAPKPPLKAVSGIGSIEAAGGLGDGPR